MGTATEAQATAAATTTDAPEAAQTTAGQDATLLGGAAEAGKGADGQTTTGQPEAKGAETQPKAPEAYSLKAFGEDFGGDESKAYAELARKLDLSQESAQQVLDAVAPAVEQRFEALASQQAAEWAKASRSDKEFGGGDLDANLATATKAAKELGGDELLAVLRETGLGNHPAVIRAFWKAGKAISNDSLVGGQGTTGGREKSLAERLYQFDKV